MDARVRCCAILMLVHSPREPLYTVAKEAAFTAVTEATLPFDEKEAAKLLLQVIDSWKVALQDGDEEEMTFCRRFWSNYIQQRLPGSAEWKKLSANVEEGMISFADNDYRGLVKACLALATTTP